MDAEDGRLLGRRDRTCRADAHATTTGEAIDILPTDAATPRPFPNQYYNLDGIFHASGPDGSVDLPIVGAGVLSTSLRGPWIRIQHLGGPDASASWTVADGDTVHHLWSDANSDLSERNVFFHGNVAHDWVKARDPGLLNIDEELVCRVNDASATCNAYWNSVHLTFNTEAAGCINSSHSPATIYHEYGHFLNDRHYQQAGSSSGMWNPSTHEAMADVLACFIEDWPEFPRGFWGPGTFSRTIDNTNRYPEDVSTSSVHTTGLILAGAFWDLRERIGLEDAWQLAHQARYGLPDDPDIGIAFAEWFLEVLLADDDDGDLGNGTPHFAEIVESFNLHGIGTGLYLQGAIDHAEHPDTEVTDAPYAIAATIDIGLPFSGPLDVAVVYRLDDQPPQTILPATALGGSDFGAEIPAQPAGTVVQYGIRVLDPWSGEYVYHPREWREQPLTFLVGELHAVVEDAFETPGDWTVGDPADNASAGIWERNIPQATWVTPTVNLQPAGDHSPVGSRCWVTGAAAGFNFYDHDVDGGRTTLYSGVYDLTAMARPIVRYWDYYSNNLGPAPSEDPFVLQATEDGSSWVTVRSSTFSTNAWQERAFPVESWIPAGPAVQFRFIAADYATGSYVEALVDDFEILDLGAPPPSGGIDVRDVPLQVFPNPSAGDVTVTLPGEAGRLRLIDAAGRTVEVWEVSAGSQTVRAMLTLPRGLYRWNWSGEGASGTVAWSVLEEGW